MASSTGAPWRLNAPTPLEYFASLVADDAQLPFLEAAVSIAQDDDPRLDVQAVLAEIDALADRLRRRLPADAGALQRLRALNQYFFQELGFGGNVNHYDDPRNSYLHEVLATRRGIPISLAVLYIELALQNGLDARGISFPGHFLVKVRLSQGEVVIDPFSGQSLTREALDERLVPYRQRLGGMTDAELPLGLFLQTATPREVLARMLRNLKAIHRSAHDEGRLLAVLDRLVVLLPDDWSERRDRGLLRADLGATFEAAEDLASYLDHCPEAADRRALAERLQALRAAGRPRLH